MTNFEGKRIAVLRGYGRLIDGETTSVEEMYQWGKENGVEFKAFHLHPVWKRKVPTYNDGYEHPYKVFSRDTIEEVEEELNTYDAIILINPARMVLKLKEPDIRAFHDLYTRLKPIKVMMQHNHVPKTMNSIPFLYSYLEHSDKVMSLSESGHFKQLLEDIPSIQTFEKFTLWRDILKYGNLKDEKDRENKMLFVGRFSPYKGPITTLNLAPALYANGIETEMYGMDTSIGCKSYVLNHPAAINVLQGIEKSEGEITPVHGLLEPSEVVPKLSKVMFSSHLITLKNKLQYETFGNKLEYVMQEAIVSGAILVISKQWAEWCGTYDGRKFKDIENFAVILDPEDPYDGIQEMKRIIADPELAQKYRDTAYNILLEDYEITRVLPNLISRILFTRKKPTYLSVEEIIRLIVKNPEEEEKLINLYNQGDTAIPMSPNSLRESVVHSYGGKSGKAIVRL